MFFCHHEMGEYGEFRPMSLFESDKLRTKGWYRLGRVIAKADLDGFTEDALVIWVRQTIEQLACVYEWCHGDEV